MAVDPAALALLQRQLDDFDPRVRKEALAALMEMVGRGEIFLPPPGDETNVHSHTSFSFNAYGYSPTGFAWRARRRGLAVAGIVDFDVLHGLQEVLTCGTTLNLRTTGGLETRVFVPELKEKEINSPREPGVCYFMGMAFGRVPPAESGAGRVLDRLYRLAQDRNRGIMERVNGYLGTVTIDYEQDVIPLTPSRNPTERHLLAAYDQKARRDLGRKTPAFWAEALQLAEDEIRAAMGDGPRFHELLRARLMKYGSPGYVPPEAGSFPLLEEVIGMVKEAGGLPTATWLDGTSDGEAPIGELLDFLLAAGVVAVNTIPERNWNVPELEERKRKIRNLMECIEACRARELPLVAGTEMNKHGQPFVDSFRAPELAPFVQDFLSGAILLYGHTVAARYGPWAYFSNWAEAAFGPVGAVDGRRRRNEFYRSLGSHGPLSPARSEALSRLGSDKAPEAILAVAGA